MQEDPTRLFGRFRAEIGTGSAAIDTLRAGLVGKGAMLDGPFGPRTMIYADYVASGRALTQVETFVMENVLPWYANSHTEASHCGAAMTRFRRAARAEIGRQCSAGPGHAVIFAGNGATSGINRLVHLFGIGAAVAAGARPLVLTGPYEHHSNILPWRESGAEVLALPEASCGGPCLATLRAALAAAAGRPVVGAFSAASNVTGHLTDVVAVTRILRQAGARVIWDYAGGGPYLPIAMTPAPDAPIDAVVVSPHKFAGGPAASGVLIVRRDAVQALRPSLPGGGTVRFVSPTGHDYAESVEAREEAGTPDVIGDIRAALAFIVKAAVGTDTIARRHRELDTRALPVLRGHPRVRLLGRPGCDRLPFYSFRIADGRGGFVHQQLVTRMLSDLHGVQARGGCACAGPYVHALLGIGPEDSARLRAAVLAGAELEKPGFTRLNLSWLLTDAEAARIVAAVTDIADRASALSGHYRADAGTAIFAPVELTPTDATP